MTTIGRASGAGLDTLDVRRGIANVLRGLELPGGQRPKVGRYEIESLLGHGSFGRVYRARDTQLQRDVALKVIAVGTDEAESMARSVLSEARALAALSDPGVVQVFDVFTHFRDEPLGVGTDVDEAASLVLVMELIDGWSLDVWRQRARPDLRTIVDVHRRAGLALEAAHAAGIVHRDFKPSNAMVGKDGRVTVLDFGLARTLVSQARVTSVGDSDTPEGAQKTAVAGTPAYMAPEQFEGAHATAATDVFALASTLYEALYDERPFSGSSLADLYHAKRTQTPSRHRTATVPAWLHDAILRGLAPQPSARWPTMAAFIRALEPPRRRRYPLVVAATGVGALGIWLGNSDAPGFASRCVRESQELPERWQRQRPAAAKRLASVTDAPVSVLARVDAYVEDWRTRRHQACVAPADDGAAEHVRGCLDQLRPAIEGELDALASTGALHRLADLELTACDPAAVDGIDPLPADPELRERIARLSARIAGWSNAGPGEIDDAERVAAIEEAEAAGHRPTLARVLIEASLLDARVEAIDRMHVRAERAYFVADSAGDPRQAMIAATQMILAQGPSEATRWYRTALALAERVENGERLVARAHTYRAFGHMEAGNTNAALRTILPAATWAMTRPEDDWWAAVILTRTVHFAIDMQAFDEGAPSAEALERRLASHHLDDAMLQNDGAVQLAIWKERTGDVAGGEHTLRVMLQRVRPAPDQALIAQLNLARLVAMQGRDDEAQQLLEQFRPNDPEGDGYAVWLLAHASVATTGCRRADAARDIEAARTLFVRLFEPESQRFHQLAAIERALAAAPCP